ncbi:hypothetical protein MRX96_032439 [Rhipicephalus microplus]
MNAGANVWNNRMWPDNSSPALQAFHLAFGIGGLVAPFIARPFLSPVPGGNSTGMLNHTFERTGRIYLTANHNTRELSKELLELQRDDGLRKSKVHYAFAIVSAFNVLLVVSMIVLYFVDRSDFKPEDPTGNTGATSRPSNDVRFTRIVLALLCACSFTYATLECTSSEMFAPFAVKGGLRFSKDAASRVVAVFFFFCFSCGHLTGTLFTIKVSMLWLIAASHIILLPTEAMLVTWGSSILMVLWAGSALTGFALGPLNAGVMAWTAKYITITKKMMSMVIVMGCLASMTSPVFAGQFIEGSPKVFFYVCLAAASLCAAIFVTMYFYVRVWKRSDENQALPINRTAEDTSQDVIPPPDG